MVQFLIANTRSQRIYFSRKIMSYYMQQVGIDDFVILKSSSCVEVNVDVVWHDNLLGLVVACGQNNIVVQLFSKMTSRIIVATLFNRFTLRITPRVYLFKR